MVKLKNIYLHQCLLTRDMYNFIYKNLIDKKVICNDFQLRTCLVVLNRCNFPIRHIFSNSEINICLALIIIWILATMIVQVESGGKSIIKTTKKYSQKFISKERI